MPFDTIPAIPEDYPLYDWADWQSSRDALVQGGPTKYFAIAAWNAIVDGLANAITAAGQEWDTTYTTAAGAKITAANRKLYAQKFNSVRLNIDRQMHLDWPWAVNPETRGYVGREDFQGRQDVGKACDLVYPEYILELVRKLNLLLEIMRGTGPICNVDVPQPSGTQISADAKSGVGARVDCKHNASTMLSAPALSRQAAHVEAAVASSSQRSVEVQPHASVPIYYNRNVPAPISAEGQAKPGIPTEPEPLALSSNVSAEAWAVKPLPTDADVLCGSSIQVDASPKQALPLTPDGVVAQSSMEAEPGQGLSLPASGTVLSGSQVEIGDVPLRRPRPAECACLIGTKISCAVTDTAWLPPIWVNGGLWIRQVHDAPVQRDNGDLEVT